MTLSAKIDVFMDFLVILGCETHFKRELLYFIIGFSLCCAHNCTLLSFPKLNIIWHSIYLNTGSLTMRHDYSQAVKNGHI